MKDMELCGIKERLSGNRYPGRGIVVGKTPDGKKAAAAYFIMGRSANSRNRIFALRDDVLFTEPFDPEKVEDPSLIIYAAVRSWQNRLIVTNGDQTDTIAAGFEAGKTFSGALESRDYEPDAPNFTPRISAVLTFLSGDFSYEMSLLKSVDEKGGPCARFTFSYPALPGEGHFLHTYVCDGNPLPPFRGEPERISIPDSADEFAREIWEALDENNRISLYVRFTNLETGATEEKIINRNR